MNTADHSPSESPSESTLPAIEKRLEELLSTQGYARQIDKTSTKKQRAFVKRVSKALKTDEQEVLGVLCKHVAHTGNLQSALSYIEMYVDAGKVSPTALAEAFQDIILNSYERNSVDTENNPQLVRAPKGLFRVMEKIEKNHMNDIDGTIALMKGKVAQIFTGDIDRAIEQYRLALEKQHPNACFFLALALSEAGLYEEGLEVAFRGWNEFRRIDCLVEHIRLLFIVGKDTEAIEHYEIFKGIAEDVLEYTPHIIECIPLDKLSENFSAKLPILLDYMRMHHTERCATAINPKIYQCALDCIRSRFIELDEEQKTITQTIVSLEKEGLDTAEIKAKKREITLALLETLEIGAIYLLDTDMTTNYLENLLAFLQGHTLNREILAEHIANSSGYARRWIENRSMKVVDMDDVEMDEETGEIVQMTTDTKPNSISYPMTRPRNEPWSIQDNDDTEGFLSDFMGVLNILRHHSIMNYTEGVDTSALRVQIQEAILADPDFSHLQIVQADIAAERSVFDILPKYLQEWYSHLEETIDSMYTPFVRKKIQGTHRFGGSMMPTGAKEMFLFLVFDGLVSSEKKELVDQYMKSLTHFELTYAEGFNLAQVLKHFGYEGFVLELLCGGRLDWGSMETLIMAVRLIIAMPDDQPEKIVDILGFFETSIRQQGYDIDNLQEFLTISLDNWFSGDEPVGNRGLLYELAGLVRMQYGDMDEARKYFIQAYEAGNTNALFSLSKVYMMGGDYEQAYASMKTAYNEKKQEYLLYTEELAELAIYAGRRDEVPQYLEIMEKYHLDRDLWIRFFLDITGSASQKIRAIRFIGCYGNDIPDSFDHEVVDLAREHMTIVRDNRESTLYDRLSCQRGLARLESEGQFETLAYWHMLEKLVIEENFEALSEHLSEFIDTDIQETPMFETNEANLAYEAARAGLVSEALAFRRQRQKDADFTILFDLMYQVCSVFPENAKLMKDWQEEIQKIITPEESFELGYELGRFGEAVTLQ